MSKMSYSPEIRMTLSFVSGYFIFSGRKKKREPVVLCFSVVGAANKSVFITVKRGILDNFFTTVDICKIRYIAQIGNPFIHFVLQYISSAELRPTVCDTVLPSL